MASREEKFRQRLMATFLVEAEEHIGGIISGMGAVDSLLEDNSVPEQALIEPIYRQFHSLKGASQAIGFDQVGQSCQAAESILSVWKSDPSTANRKDIAKIVELTLGAAHELNISIPMLEEEAASIIAGARNTPVAPMASLSKVASKTTAEENLPVPSARAAGDKALPSLSGNVGSTSPSNSYPSLADLSGITTVEGATRPRSANTPDIESLLASDRVSSDSSDTGTTNPNIPLRAGKKSSNATNANNATAPRFMSSMSTLATRSGSETIRIASDKLDSLLRRGEQLVLARLNSRVRWTESQELLATITTLRKKWEEQSEARDAMQNEANCEALRHFTGSLQRHVRNLAADHHELNTQLRALLDEVKSARLAPVRPLLEELEMAARRIARQLSKKVRITCSGGELELDRSIMEALKDPLIHLVRNALDHGLEQAEERRKSGKAPEGRLTLSVSSRGTGTMEFRISDDGRGIQTDEVLEAARKQGLIADGVEIDSLDLIFSSGVSTRHEVSELSGRGLGMAIVREKVEALKGSVRVQTKIGQGTTFILSMPTSLATFDGLLVKERDRYLVFPINGVEAVARFYNNEVHSVEGSRVINFRGSLAPISRLGEVLNLPAIPGHVDSEQLQAVIVAAGGRKAAFLVDEIFGAHEVLSRDLGPQLKKVRYVIGACMIDYQQVVPVLNVADLLTRIRGTARVTSLATESHTPYVLVADDSITTRTLMRGLLESANYQVKVAADGSQAWELLQQEDFDIVVSDVDMPGITGFDLTVKIRQSPKLRNLPLILVTGQERPEDKQRGLKLGASSYILKSRFDEGGLLDAVERLVGQAPSYNGPQ